MIPGPQGDPGLPGADGAPGTMGDVEGTTVSPDPTANTTSAAQLMMGLGGTITPITSGRVAIFITGMMEVDVGMVGQVQIRYGIAPVPSNGDAATGTAAGAAKNMKGSTTAGKQGFALCAVVSGLTVGVPYWIDVGLARVTGTSAAIFDVDVVAMET